MLLEKLDIVEHKEEGDIEVRYNLNKESNEFQIISIGIPGDLHIHFQEVDSQLLREVKYLLENKLK